LDLFRFIPGYRGVIFNEGKEPLFLSLVAFVIAFAGARGYSRLARQRGWGSGSIGGVHLHHNVVGIALLLGAGLAVLTPAGSGLAAREICAVFFGVGAAFVLDEFALVFYLRDVYWSKEGRTSVDAVILAIIVSSLLLVVSEPFGLDDPLTSHLGRAIFFVVVVENVLFAVITLLKGKLFTGVAAIAVPPCGWVGALRLARPRSPWARWLYGAEKSARADRRVEDGFATRFQQRLIDLIGGKPSAP
jgi:hypothetical protein